MTTRQQRRATERSQLKLGKSVAAFDDAINALPSDAGGKALSMPELMHRMGQAVVDTTLKDDTEVEKVIQIAQGVKYGVAQITQEAMSQLAISIMPIDCVKGCDSCCYMNVVASPVEVLNIAKALRAKLSVEELNDVTDQIRIVAARVAALPSIAARDGARIPCGLLKDHMCSAYTARPLSCLGWTSSRKQDCVDNYEGKTTGTEYSMFGPLFTAATSIGGGMQRGLLDAKLDATPCELNAGLLIALDTPMCEERWLAGETLFETALVKHVDEPVPAR